MRIMVLSDIESKSLWDFFEKSKLDNIDLIISCGDLSPHYLSFLATFAKVPVFYVHGNHDECYEMTPPGGCTCIDDNIVVYKGVRIVGLGGALRYKPGPFMYTQRDMKYRAHKLRMAIWRKKGFDILVTHAPAYQINDGEDLPHMGFIAFRDMLDKYSPKYFIHGHVHPTYGREHVRLSSYKDTQIINAYEKYIVDIESPEDSAECS